jgi:hypothetical protein
MGEICTAKRNRNKEGENMIIVIVFAYFISFIASCTILAVVLKFGDEIWEKLFTSPPK